MSKYVKSMESENRTKESRHPKKSFEKSGEIFQKKESLPESSDCVEE